MLIPPKIFAVASHADNTSTRFALNGVQFERGENLAPYAIATDGHRAIAVSWNEENAAEYPATGIDASPVEGFAAIIPTETCKQAGRVKIKARKAILQNVAMSESPVDGRLAIGATDLEKFPRFDTKQLDGRFPKWREVFSWNNYTPENSLSVCVDPTYLAEACEALKKIATTDENKAVTLTVAKDRTAERPIVISAAAAGSGARGCAVIMPLAAEKVDGRQIVAVQWNPATGKSCHDLIADYCESEAAREAAESCESAPAKITVDELDKLRRELADAKTEAAEQLQIATDTAKRLRREVDELATENKTIRAANIDISRKLGAAEKLAKSYADDQRKGGRMAAENDQLRNQVKALQAAFNESERRREAAEAKAAVDDTEVEHESEPESDPHEWARRAAFNYV